MSSCFAQLFCHKSKQNEALGLSMAHILHAHMLPHVIAIDCCIDSFTFDGSKVKSKQNPEISSNPSPIDRNSFAMVLFNPPVERL